MECAMRVVGFPCGWRATYSTKVWFNITCKSPCLYPCVVRALFLFGPVPVISSLCLSFLGRDALRCASPHADVFKHIQPQSSMWSDVLDCGVINLELCASERH